MRRVTGRAFARAGLLGNPSDGYGGKAIAMVLENFRAQASIEPCDHFELVADDTHRLVLPTLGDVTGPFSHRDGDGGLRLMRAAVRRFLVHAPHLAASADADPRARFSVRFETDIPRQVGLSGSSAIVIAVMRALMAWYEQPVAPAELAELALAAEVEDLGLAGGAMDRVIQTYEGVVVMDLREPRTAASYASIDPELLPPLFVAFDPRGGEPSGHAHGALRARWDAGDEDLRRIMAEFRSLVDAGAAALEQGDFGTFAELMNRNFELRSSFFPISERDREMVAIARRLAASGKLCGSGGAIVGQLRDAADIGRLQEAYDDAGFYLIRPRSGRAK